MARQRENKDLEKEKKDLANSLATQTAATETGFITQEVANTNTTLEANEQAVLDEITKEIETTTAEQEKFQPSDSSFDRAIDSISRRLRRPKKIKPQAIPQVRDEVTLKIEKILEEGLQDAYREMNVVQKQEFKIKGEQTAFAIRALLSQTHVKIKNVFRLILEWLRVLPGVNRFFLEQEAKIKTDKIISIFDQENHRRF